MSPQDLRKPRRIRNTLPSVESLEGRALLSHVDPIASSHPSATIEPLKVSTAKPIVFKGNITAAYSFMPTADPAIAIVGFSGSGTLSHLGSYSTSETSPVSTVKLAPYISGTATAPLKIGSTPVSIVLTSGEVLSGSVNATITPHKGGKYSISQKGVITSGTGMDSGDTGKFTLMAKFTLGGPIAGKINGTLNPPRH